MNIESKFSKKLQEEQYAQKQQGKMTTYFTAKNQQDRVIAKLEANLQHAIEEKENIQQQLNQARLQVEKYEQMTQLYKTKVQNLEVKQQKLSENEEKQNQEEKQELVDQSMQVSKYVDQSMVNKYQNQISDVQQQLDEKNEQIQQLQQELQQEKEKSQQLYTQVNTYKQQNQILQQSEQELQQQLQQQSEYLQQLQQEVQAAQNNQALFQDYIKQLEYKIQDLKGKIRICIRVKPSKGNQFKLTYPDRLNLKQTLGYKQVRKDITGRLVETQQECKMDRIFSSYDQQQDVFEEIKPLIKQLLDGYSALIFAYGQSGSGKTYTQLGDKQHPGLISNCLTELFQQLEQIQDKYEIKVAISFYEIYNEKCYDLLADQTLNLLASSAIEAEKQGSKFEAPECKISMIKNDVKIVNLNQIQVENIEQINDLITISQSRRKTSATILNDVSSRSHAIFTVNLTLADRNTFEEVKSSLSFVDLAGCEQLGQKVDPQRKQESIYINKSLSALGNIFISLKTGQSFVNYRDSVLTKILQPYFQGNNKVIMIACITSDNENEANYQENLNTISFCQRVNAVTLQKNEVK